MTAYRGRLAPTPTGYFHQGHARTFGEAARRAHAAGGVLILRNEDLDRARCKPAYVQAMYEDFRWLGFQWQEGPDIGGPHASYTQSERNAWYVQVWERLRDAGCIYPSPHSRKDVHNALVAPHAGDDAEPVFPPELRPAAGTGRDSREPDGVNWRFRVPDGETITFDDGRRGRVAYTAGQDFGDFLVWRKDGFASYEMAVVADDHAMAITEVVRGEDLLLSTARQLLLYRALGWPPPAFHHCELVTDGDGKRLAKRDNALAIRTLREQGAPPHSLLP